MINSKLSSNRFKSSNSIIISIFISYFTFSFFSSMLGEVADQYPQDVVTDALFSSIGLSTPILSTHTGQHTYTNTRTSKSPQLPSQQQSVDTESFPAVSGFLFSTRLSADGIWQVRVSLRKKCWHT